VASPASAPPATAPAAPPDGRKPQLDTLAVGLLLLCCALWGLAQVATKLTLAEIPPLTQAALRSAGAALLLLAWCRLRGPAFWARLLARDGSAPGGWAAGALFAAEFACIFIGLQYTSASRMVVFIYLAPFVVALGMPLVARGQRNERLTRWQLACLLGAFGGVVLAFAEGFMQPSAGPLQWLGDALGIAAALLWGLTTLVLRGSRLGQVVPEKALLYQLGVSALALGLAAAWAGEAWPQRLSPSAWGLLGFQAAVVSFASYLVWFWLVRHYPATRLAAFTLLTPLFGLLAGVGLLGEPLTLQLLLALAAVCAGIAGVNLAAPRLKPLPPREPPP
jgi:drug/metabolite transporter (DMT)-like permease